MIFVECVDVVTAVETSVHAELYLVVSEDIQFVYQLVYRFNIRYITCKFTIVEWKP